MTFYAIRSKSIGGFLPTLVGTTRRGFSHTEPTLTIPPRLHIKLTSARAALRCWLEGKWGNNYSYDGEPEGPRAHKILERKAEDMEIVIVHLTIQGMKNATTQTT